MLPVTAAVSEGRPHAELVGVVRAYLAEDDYHRAGALVRAHPELLGEPAARVLRRAAARGARNARRLAAQHTRFLDRCRAAPDAVFPPGHPVIDPLCYALVADRHQAAEQAETLFDEAESSVERAGHAARWAAAWTAVADEAALETAHPSLRAALLNDAARAQLLCYYAIGGVRRLQRARAWGELAVALTPEASPRAATRRSNLGLILLELAEAPGTPDPPRCRTEALTLLRAAARSAEAGGSAWTDCHVRLALGRLHAFWADGRARHLDAAVRDLVSVWRAGAAQADVAHTLGSVLRQRYTARGGVSDLESAVALLSAASDSTPSSSPHRLRRSLDLGVALLDLHQHEPADTTLAAAGEALRVAVTAAPETSPDRASALGHCAAYWYRVFEASGELTALDTARGLAREAAEAPAVRSGEHALWLLTHAVILEETARQSADPGLLDRALGMLTALTEAGSPLLVRRAALAGAGAAWRDRFALSGDLGDLDRAVRLLEQAAPDGPARSPEDARIALLLVLARFERYVFAGRPRSEDPLGDGRAAARHADLLGALASVRSLARRRTPALDRHRIRCTLLVVTLAAAEAGLTEASVGHLRRTVRRIRADAARTDTETLLWVGTLWGRWATGAGRPRDAALGYRIAVEALHRLTRRQADRWHGAWWLRSGGQLTGEAAYAAASAGDPREAVRLMETGRCVLLSETLLLAALRTGPAPAGLPPELLRRLTAAARRLGSLETARTSPLGAL